MSSSLRQKLGKSILSGSTSVATRATASQAAVVNYTNQHQDLTSKWVNRLRMTANTHDGRDKLG